MAKKTKSETAKAAPPGTTANPASTVSKPESNTPPGTTANPAPATVSATEVPSSPGLSEQQIGEIIARSVIGNPPVQAVTAATEEERTHPPEEGATQDAADPETAATEDSGQESSPEDTAAAESEEDVLEGQEDGQEDDGPEAAARDGRQRRIDKLTARNGALREELAELQDQLKALNQQRETSNEKLETISPGHPELRQVEQHLAQQAEILRWAEANPDGAEVTDAKGQTITYDAAQVRQIKANAMLSYSRASAAREVKAEALTRDLQSQFTKHHAEAAQQFPWLQKKASPEYQEALEIVRKAPALLGLPDHELLLGYMVEGKRSLAAKTKTAKLPPRVAPAPRMPGLATNSPPNTRAMVDPAAGALKRIANGDSNAVTDYFVAHLNGRAA